MGRRTRGIEREALRHCWCRWTAIVDLFARRRPARRRVDPGNYAVLHRSLLASCRTLAESAEAESRAYYEGLELLARPWLSPGSLARADGEILSGLLARCRQVELELGGRGLPLERLGRAILALAAAASVAGLLGLVWAAGLDPSSGLDLVRDWSDTLWFAARRASDFQKLSGITVVVILASIYGVTRTARS